MKSCEHNFLESGGNCCKCGESSITITQQKPQSWEKEFYEEFTTSDSHGHITYTPIIKQDCEGIIKFISNLLSQQKEEFLNQPANKHDQEVRKQVIEEIKQNVGLLRQFVNEKPENFLLSNRDIENILGINK